MGETPRPIRSTVGLHFAVAVFLSILVLSAYANTLRNGFVWDDTKQILQNPYVRPGAPWLQFFSSDVWSFTHTGKPAVNNYYRPLQMLAYRLTAQLFGFSAPAFHMVNLVFHLLATLLVYLLVHQLTSRITFSTGAAALFASHPIHTEAVAWVSALPELGCTVFLLLACYLFLLAINPSPALSAQQASRLFGKPWLWICSCTCFAVALLWKEMAVTLPLLVTLYVILLGAEGLPVAARHRRTLQATFPYWVVVAAYLPLRYHALGFLYVSQRKWPLSPGDYILSVSDLVTKYWWLLLFPLHLNAYHVFSPVRSLVEPRALGAILFLLVAMAGFAYGFRRFPLPTFAASWVFVTLLPVLNLRGVGRNVFAERYLYVPSVGFCLILVWLASKALAGVPVGCRRGGDWPSR
ncbi:MAG TPA: hypothetical protein VKO18_14630 [Terriglobia bacterium]|nr:hypothetical protein [Terriglobia bacterium]